MSAVLDFPVKPEARPYLDAFTDNADEPDWLRDVRRRNLNRFAELGFPTRRSESWRYFDLHPFEREPLPVAAPDAPAAVPAAPAFDGSPMRMSLLNGGCVAEASRDAAGGVWFHSMRHAVCKRPELARAAIGDEVDAEPLARLDTALFRDGFALDIPSGVAVDGGIAVAHFAAAPGSSHTRSIVNLGAGARATLIETYSGETYSGCGRYWHNDVVKVRLGAGAELTRVILVEEAEEALHTALSDVALQTGAAFRCFVLMLSGSRVRHEINVRLAGQGARCQIDGAYVVSGIDETNIVTAIDHAAPGGETRELIKGVAAGRGHGAFQGRIVVREHAQKTDARQTSRNLLLGRRAVIDTKPELEILADDVKCAHGASVGDLDETALFYLRGRGIPLAEARRMLIEAFLREAVDGVEDAAIRDHLQGRLARRLANLE